MEHSDISDDDFEHEHHLKETNSVIKIKYIKDYGIHNKNSIA